MICYSCITILLLGKAFTCNAFKELLEASLRVGIYQLIVAFGLLSKGRTLHSQSTSCSFTKRQRNRNVGISYVVRKREAPIIKGTTEDWRQPI